MTPCTGKEGLAFFGCDPWWLILGKGLVVFVFLLLSVLMCVWAERRVIGRMQLRPGPNRAGPFGLLQPLADGIKGALKEDIVPRKVDKVVFFIAPVLAATPALVSFAIIPLEIGRASCQVTAWLRAAQAMGEKGPVGGPVQDGALIIRRA